MYICYIEVYENFNHSPLIALPIAVALVGAAACSDQEVGKSGCQVITEVVGSRAVKLSIEASANLSPQGYTRTDTFKYGDGAEGIDHTHTYPKGGDFKPWAILRYKPIPGALPESRTSDLTLATCSSAKVTLPQ